MGWIAAAVLMAPLASPTGGVRFRAAFADGGTANVVAADAVLTVATKYGPLRVPLADVVKVEFAFRYPAGTEAKVTAAAAALGSPSFRAREDAQKELLAFGAVAVPALRAAEGGTNPEAAGRAADILRALAKALPKERLAARPHDVVETATMTIRGTIETPALNMRAVPFGAATVKVSDLLELRAAKPGE